MTELEQIIVRSHKKSEKTRASYLHSVKLFESFAGRRRLTGQLVEDWRDAMAKQGLAASTINLRLSAIRYVSQRLAVLRSDARMDFARGTEGMPAADQVRPPRLLTVEECRALLSDANRDTSLRGCRDHAALQIGLHTGVRRAGLVGVTVDKLVGRDITFLLKGKKRTVTTPLGAQVLTAVKEWLFMAGIKRGYLLRGLSRPDIEGQVYVTDSISESGLYKALKRRADDLGIDGFHPHAMRHAFVTYARAAGVPDWRINLVTGHADKAAGTIEKYTHDTNEKPVGDYLPF